MVPWLIAYAVATIVSLLTLFLKIKVFRDHIRHRWMDLAVHAQFHLHECMLWSPKGLTEGIPMGILQVFFLPRHRPFLNGCMRAHEWTCVDPTGCFFAEVQYA